MKKWACFVLILFSFTLFFAAYKTYMSVTHPLKYGDIIIENALALDLSPALVASVINVESGFNKNAVSNKNAIGLMQLKDDTVKYLIEHYKLSDENVNLFDEKTNIKFGCLYLNYLIKKFQNINTALASYNAGETRVRVWLGDKNFSIDGISLNNIPFEETKNYVKKVNENLKFYDKCFSA